jgi:hypothetical protein
VLYEYSPLKTGAISCLSLLLGTACNEVIRVTLQNEGSSVDKMNTDRISGILTPKIPNLACTHGQICTSMDSMRDLRLTVLATGLQGASGPTCR